jgi:hypothetical protein
VSLQRHLVLLLVLKPYCCTACCAAVHARARQPPMLTACEAWQGLTLLLLLLLLN